MRLLLDTMALLSWLQEEDFIVRRIAPHAPDESWRPAIVSVASFWEIAIKRRLGKIAAPDDLPQRIAAHSDFEILPITAAHVWATQRLPVVERHKDPFDRLLVAVALEEKLTVVTDDPAFPRYGAPVLW